MISVDTGAAARDARRVKVFQPAMLVGHGPACRIHLLDISRTGALAHAHEPPESGLRVRLECSGIARGAIVKWSDGKRFGLLFDRPLLAVEVERLTGAAPTSPRLAASHV